MRAALCPEECPVNPQVTIPARPISGDDLQIFICTQCKKVKSSNVQYELQERKGILDLRDMLEHSADKLAFLGYFFIVSSDRLNNSGFEWSDEDATGLGHILEGIRNDLEIVLKNW
jgi:hypothetical protein